MSREVTVLPFGAVSASAAGQGVDRCRTLRYNPAHEKAPGLSAFAVVRCHGGTGQGEGGESASAVERDGAEDGR